MRRRATWLPLMLLLCWPSPPALAADPYADWRIPEHRRFDWNLRGTGSWAGNTSSPTPRSGRGASSGVNGAAHWHLESERSSVDLDADGVLDWQRRSSETVYEDPLSAVDFATTRGRTDRQALSAHARADHHPHGGPWFFGGELRANPEFTQDVVTERRVLIRNSFSLDDERAGDDHYYLVNGSTALQLGHGRIRDASGVYFADIAVRRLRAAGRLRHEPTPDALRQLATAYYLSPDLSIVYERAQKRIWRVIERILREDGALTDSTLDAWMLERLKEPLNRQSVARQRGLRVAAVGLLDFERGHVDRTLRLDYNSIVPGYGEIHDHLLRFDREHVDGSRWLQGAELRYERPVGADWQVSLLDRMLYGDGELRQLQLRSDATTTWLLGERWYAQHQQQYRLTSSRTGETRAHPDWHILLFQRAGYWVEDAWTVDVSWLWQQHQDRLVIGDHVARQSRRSSWSVAAGLSYNPAGRLHAPDLAPW